MYMPLSVGWPLGPGSSLAGARSSGTRPFSCPGRVQRALLRERNETRDPARKSRSARLDPAAGHMRWPVIKRGSTPSARHGGESHRLEGAIELDVDEHGLVGVECMGNEIGRLVHGLGALGCDTERARQRHEIDLGIKKLHADIAVGLLGKPAHAMQALLENAVGTVVEDHKDGADAVVRGGPK